MSGQKQEKSIGDVVDINDPKGTDFFVSFTEYPFKTDEEFLIGWKELMSALPKDLPQPVLIERFLSAKLFYYGRKMGLSEGQVDTLKHNLLAISKTRCDMNVNSTTTSVDTSSDDAVTHVSCSSASQETTSNPVTAPYTLPADQLADKHATINSTTCAPQFPTSFKQVMESIERGEDIPGLESIVVTPTNEAISDSILQLPKKPWEK